MYLGAGEVETISQISAWTILVAYLQTLRRDVCIQSEILLLYKQKMGYLPNTEAVILVNAMHVVAIVIVCSQKTILSLVP